MDDVDYGRWAGYIRALLERRGVLPGARLLECGCGTGSVTIPLKKAGFDITGTDLSPDMLAAAGEKARRAGLRIPFVRMDMRSLAVHRPVRAVIACCDCVNYLTSLSAVSDFFRSAFAALDPGGMLLFDISSRHKLENVLGGNCFSDSRSDRAYFWRNDYDNETKLIEMRLEFFVRAHGAASAGGAPLYERFSERHIQRAHTAEELVSRLRAAGFADISVCDAFTFDPPAEESERLQFAASKPKE